MEFTINSKQKKVELFYESTEEQRAILELVSKWVIYKENYTSTSVYRDISWADVSGAKSYNDSLGTINTVGTTITTNDNNILNTRIAALEDIPSNCIHVTAKSK